MITFSPPGRASRKDLLVVQDSGPVTAADPVRVLREQGFRVVQQAPDHWVLTRGTPLPELHFYSRDELARFAGDRARFYRPRASRHWSDSPFQVVDITQPDMENVG